MRFKATNLLVLAIPARPLALIISLKYRTGTTQLQIGQVNAYTTLETMRHSQ